tara:strand:- start:44 stop:166 length:123 start_codon:yes stop_codon:yes gene_type:complete
MSLRENIRKRNIQLAKTKQEAGMTLSKKEKELLDSLKIEK